MRLRGSFSGVRDPSQEEVVTVMVVVVVFLYYPARQLIQEPHFIHPYLGHPVQEPVVRGGSRRGMWPGVFSRNGDPTEMARGGRMNRGSLRGMRLDFEVSDPSLSAAHEFPVGV
jgi:hypothetical protein